MIEDDFAIVAENLRKGFSLSSNPLRNFYFALFGKEPKPLYMAVDGISLVIRKGESVGLMGLNGAGKSTLLSMIMGVLTPTSGKLVMNGRTHGITSLGFAFEGERSGRSNIFQYGFALGFSYDEVKKKLNEIIDFSELEKFIDRPVRTYSSGMYARLAFSVAVCFEPDILVLDEVLAVGDISFRAKCSERIQKMVRNGTTLLFVSHDTNELIHHCRRGVWIEQGQIRADGPIAETCHYFVQFSKESNLRFLSSSMETDKLSHSPKQKRFGNGKLRIIKCQLEKVGHTGVPISICKSGDLVSLVVVYEVNEATTDFNFGFNILNQYSMIIWGTATEAISIDHLTAYDKENSIQCHFNANFTGGDYLIYVGLKAEGNSTDEIWPALQLRVLPRGDFSEIGISHCHPKFFINSERLPLTYS